MRRPAENLPFTRPSILKLVTHCVTMCHLFIGSWSTFSYKGECLSGQYFYKQTFIMAVGIKCHVNASTSQL
jgi:hypothetical protein